MQLLVRVISKTNPKDPVLDSKLTKAGDVIVFKQDGEEWGVEEVKNPDWRIISVPKMTEEQAIALISPELPPTLDKTYPLLQRRAMKLDITQLDALAAGMISADQTAKIQQIDATVQQTKDGEKTQADLKTLLAAVAVDATVQADDVMAIAAFKPPLDGGK